MRLRIPVLPSDAGRCHAGGGPRASHRVRAVSCGRPGCAGYPVGVGTGRPMQSVLYGGWLRLRWFGTVSGIRTARLRLRLRLLRFSWARTPTTYDISGSLRLQVSPRQTEVFIDGYYAGTVTTSTASSSGSTRAWRARPRAVSAGPSTWCRSSTCSPEKHRTSVRRCSRCRRRGPPVRPAGRITPPQSDPRQGRGPARPGPGPGPAILVTRFRASGLADPSTGDRAMPSTAGSHCACSRETPVCMIDGERWEGLASAERLVVQLAAGTARHRD